MEELKILITRVGPQKARPFVCGKVKQLLNSIANDSWGEDQKIFTGVNKDQSISRAKRKLRNALIGLLLTNPEQGPAQKRALHECAKIHATVTILRSQGERKASASLAQKGLDIALKYEFIELGYLLAEVLKNNAGFYGSNAKDFKKHSALCDQLLKNLNDYHIVRSRYAAIALLLNAARSIGAKDRSKIAQYAQDSITLSQSPSVHVRNIAYNILIINASLENNNKKVIDYCDQAIDRLTKNSTNKAFAFLYKKVSPLICLGQTQEAKAVARACMDKVKKGSVNWNLALFYRIVACNHQYEYKEAYDLYKANKKAGGLSKAMAEQWKIIGAYMELLAIDRKIEPYEKHNFRLCKFINQISLFQKDKSGNLVHLYIIRAIWLLKKEKIGQFIESVEAMVKYAQRHLKGRKSYRPRTLIKMLALVSKHNFHRTAVERHTKSLVAGLNKAPILDPEIEIIPFHDLWEMVIDSLVRPKERSSKRGATLNQSITK